MANKSVWITSDNKMFEGENGFNEVADYLELNPKIHFVEAIVHVDYNPYDPDTLRLSRITGIEEEKLRKKNYRIMGLIKGAPVSEKGRYTSRTYYEDETETVPVVTETYVDVLDEAGILIRIDAHITWWNNDGSEGIKKTIRKKKNLHQAGKILKARRGAQIDYLIEGAKGTPAEPLVTAIFQHYQLLANEYEKVGNDKLKNAIEAETDPTIVGYLDTVVHPPDGTIRDSIINQIT